MVASLLARGMIVGFIAGILAFAFAHTFGEPQVDRAIAFEEQTAQAAGEAPEPEIVSRATQASIGLFTGICVYGASMGGLLALAFAYVQGRFSQQRPRLTALLLAVGAFVAIVVVPGLKYPANPPSVGDPDTIRFRTQVFFTMLALSLAAAIVAVGLARQLWDRLGGWNAMIVAGVVYIAMIVIAQAVLPDINEVPEQFSAVLLWRFRMASLGIQLVLWTVIGLGFGVLAERAGTQARPARIRAFSR